MAITCNDAWTNNTYPQTMRSAQCVGNTNRTSVTELTDGRFAIVVMDALERLRAAGIIDTTILADVDACDAEIAAYQAYCSIADIAQLSEHLSPDKAKAIVILQLTEAICNIP
jgi:hypothetical protein